MRASVVPSGKMGLELPQELGSQVESQRRAATVQIPGNVKGTGKDVILCLHVCLKWLPGCHEKEGKDILWHPQVAHGPVCCKANFVTF